MEKKLTLPQKNMYETEQFFDGTSMCNIGGVVFFKEKNINVSVLEKAVNTVLYNHDELRAKVIVKNNTPYQEISEYTYEKIEIVDLTEKEYRFMMEMWTAEPFDITNKMYDFKIVKIDERTAIYLKLHHIICDAWGALLLAQKMVSYYYKTVYMLEIPKDGIPQYDKYIEKENEYLNSKRYESDEEFWKTKFCNYVAK